MRHESVSILVLAYIIGFTTSFIAFGLDLDSNLGKETFDQNQIVLNDYVPKHSTDEVEHLASAILFTEEGLFAKVGDEEKVISGALSAGIEPGPGFHVAIPYYDISPSGQFIYYCELELAEDNTCHEYVYEVSTNMVNPIKVHKEKQFGNLGESKFAWLADDLASYDGHYTISSDQPWLFTD